CRLLSSWRLQTKELWGDYNDVIVTRISWRKGVFMRPFCDLSLKAVRVDSPPVATDRPLSTYLKEYRSKSSLTEQQLAKQLGTSLRTLKNWERGRSQPLERFWLAIRSILTASTSPRVAHSEIPNCSPKAVENSPLPLP